uniref:Uncharacterized protein n=1 Tax=Vombatus ursinus TaxID=29139 RepID=A0A4X2L5M5_VOMUR
IQILTPTLRSKPIFSVDIHPDGTKFATGGQGRSIVNWRGRGPDIPCSNTPPSPDIPCSKAPPIF